MSTVANIITTSAGSGRIYRLYNDVISLVYGPVANLTAISGYGANVWAVGNATSSKIYAHKSTDYGQTYALDLVSNVNASCTDIYAVGESDVWLNQNLEIYYWDGLTWTMQKTISGIHSQNGLWMLDDTFGLCSAYSWHYNNGVWSYVADGAYATYWRPWGFSASDIWCGGVSGNLQHWTGAAWGNYGLIDGSSDELYAIWGATPSSIWAVGQNGKIAYYNGLTWAFVTSPTAEDLYDIHGVSANDIYAVGDASTVLHYDGGQWTKLNVSITGDCRGVYTYAPTTTQILQNTEPDYLYSNSVLDNGDNEIDGFGNLTRQKAIVTECHFLLRIHRGKYWYNADMGSKFWTLTTMKDAKAKAQKFAAEALKEKLDNGDILAVNTKVDTTRSGIGVHISINLPGDIVVELGFYRLGI